MRLGSRFGRENELEPSVLEGGEHVQGRNVCSSRLPSSQARVPACCFSCKGPDSPLKAACEAGRT